MFKLWQPTTILVIKFIKDLLKSIHHSIPMPNFTRLSCNTKTPINLEGVRERINEAEVVEEEEIKEVETNEEVIRIMATTKTTMVHKGIRINIITMILINIE